MLKQSVSTFIENIHLSDNKNFMIGKKNEITKTREGRSEMSPSPKLRGGVDVQWLSGLEGDHLVARLLLATQLEVLASENYILARVKEKSFG